MTLAYRTRVVVLGAGTPSPGMILASTATGRRAAKRKTQCDVYALLRLPATADSA